MKALVSLFALLSLATASVSNAVEYGFEAFKSKPEKKGPKIAIVIDDLGYGADTGRLLAQLPFPITLAVIPDTPYAKSVISEAAGSGQEVILHIPMETIEPRPWEKGLTTKMGHQGIKEKLADLFQRYPSAIGINNHGGSRLTADLERMSWVMESLAEHRLFFLDSRTTSKSLAIEAARLNRVQHAVRDIFLDNIQEEAAIEAQFEKLKQVARRRGQAIAIGHPYPSTLNALEKLLPQLQADGYELSFCSDLLVSDRHGLALSDHSQ